MGNKFKKCMSLEENNKTISRTLLAYRICKLQTAASAVGCGWMLSEKLNNREWDGGRW